MGGAFGKCHCNKSQKNIIKIKKKQLEERSSANTAINQEPHHSEKVTNKPNILPKPIPESSSKPKVSETKPDTVDPDKDQAPNTIKLKPLNLSDNLIEENDDLNFEDMDEYEDQKVEQRNRLRSLNNFILIKVVGKGTFGKVCLSKCKTTGDYFALKCIKKEYIMKTKNLKNLKNEKKILEQIEHKFIIKLHYTFQNKEKIFMAFDYYNGGELFFHLQRRGRLSERIAKFYIVELYSAITYLHSKNIIYRDLKPENIILDSEGHIKLIDFGLAKSDVSHSKPTQTLCGTNEYVPPEAIRGESYSFSFDWWGVGILLYELLYGIPPFRDTNKQTLFEKIQNTEPSYKKHNISSEAIDLLTQLLHKNVDRRITPEAFVYHPWFKDISFQDIENRKAVPPIFPRTKSQADISNIDPEFLNESVHSPIKVITHNFKDNSFGDF